MSVSVDEEPFAAAEDRPTVVVDAAFSVPQEKMSYFVRGSQVVAYDWGTGSLRPGKPLSVVFPKLPSQLYAGIDAALTIDDSRFYLFQGARLVRYKRGQQPAQDEVETGPDPVLIRNRLPDLPSTPNFHKDLNAVLEVGDDTAWFFKGNQCLRYDLSTDEVIEAPESIETHWPDLTAEAPEFCAGIAAALVRPETSDGYLIRGDQYVTCDPSTREVTSKPRPLEAQWPGLSKAFYAHAYCLCETLLVAIDINTHKALAPLRVGKDPREIVFTRDGNYAYVPDAGSDSISVVDLLLYQVGKPIPVGPGPTTLRFDLAGKVGFVANSSSETVSVVSADPQLGQVRKTITVGTYPRGVAIGPTGKYAYVSVDDSQRYANLYVIDVAKQAVKEFITAESSLEQRILFSPTGKFAYVDAGVSASSIVVFHLKWSEVQRYVETGPWRTAMRQSPNGRLLYVCSASWNRVTTIDTENPGTAGASDPCVTIEVDKHPSAAAFTPHGEYCYVTCRDANNVAVIDTALNEVMVTIPVKDEPTDLVFNQDAMRCYVAHRKSTVVSVIDTAEGKVTAEVEVGSYADGLVLTPDRGYVFVRHHEAKKVSIIKETATPEKITEVTMPEKVRTITFLT